MGLGARDRWLLIKAGKLDPNGNPWPKEGEKKQEGSKPALPSGTSFTPKKPGEVCEHPPEHILTDEGPQVGIIKICRLCGCIINDKDLKG